MCSPRKRLKLDSDSSEQGELQVVEAHSAIGNEDVLSRQVILLVETTNDSVDDETMAVVKAYDLYEKKSHIISPVTAEMITGGLCILLLNDELYVFIKGGKLFCLKDFWKEMSPTIEFHDVPAVEMAGFFYVLGCVTEENGSCERYDPISNKWSKVGVTTRKSNFCCSVALQGWIYAIGYKKFTDEGNVEKFHPESNQWKKVASTKVARGMIVATTLNGEIFVAGEDEEKRNAFVVEVYNPKQDAWTMAVFSSDPFGYLGLFTMDQTLIALRRSAYNPSPKGIEIATLDFEKCKWTLAAKFENSTLDPHPTLYCTKRLLGNYFVAVQAGEDTTVCSLRRLIEKSDYFKAAFSQEFQENLSRKIVFHGVDPAAITMCLRHINDEYFPEEYDIIDFSDKLFYVAKMLALDELVSFLSDYCGGKLSIANFQVLRTLSHKYDLILLEEKCDEFARGNFEELLQHECFLETEPDYVKYLLENRKTTRRHKVESESKVVKYLFAWMKHHEDARKEHLFEFLVTDVDLAKVQLDVLKEIVGESVISDDRKMLRKVKNAIRKRSRVHSVLLIRGTTAFHAYLPTEKKWRYTRIPWQGSKEVIYCSNAADDLYLIDGEKRLFTLRFTNPAASWQEKAPLDILIGQPCTLVFATMGNGNLYAFGVREAAKYDPADNSWSVVEFPFPRSDFAVTAYQESVYIIGGRECFLENSDVGPGLTSVLRFNTEIEQWFDDVSDMLEPRACSSAVECSGRIYAIGGSCSSGVLYSCEEYDPVLNSWSIIPPLEKPCTMMKAVSLDHQIALTATCHSGVREVAMFFTPEEDQWIRKLILFSFDRQSSVCISMPYDLIGD